MKYLVINTETGEIVYSTEQKHHAEIYRNTCNEPFKFKIITWNNLNS